MTLILIAFLVIIIIGLIIWIRELKKSLKEHFVIENALQHEVGHDDLTGLVNESLTIDRLSQAIKNAQRYEYKIAVLYLGIDYFKQENNSSGFDIPNEFIQLLSTKLVESIGEGDTVAIVNGDEFIILLEDCEDTAFVQSVINDVMDISKELFSVQHHKINVTFSLGVSLYPNDNVDTITLLSHAFTAMSLVKNAGGNGYKFYTPELAKQAFLNGKLEHELVESLKGEQMQVHYQLQVDAKDDKVIGMEALARWKHPTMGLCLSEQFISLSEEIGFIIEIDLLIIQEAIKQCRKWTEAGLNHGTLSLNLSLRTLEQDGFVDKIKEILKDDCIKDCLCFEIKEKQIMQNPQRYFDTLNELHSFGIRFTIENFGTDSFSLEYLQKLPIDKIKIDRSFVEKIPESIKDANTIKTIISIAKNMEIEVLAEGVETQEQRTFLLENSCSQMQGHFYYKPLPADEVQKKLQELT